MKRVIALSILAGLVMGVMAWAAPPTPPFMLPSQAGHAGHGLTTDGTMESWAAIAASTAASLAADPANCAAGQLALGITAAGVAECTATPSGLTSVGATTFTGALTGNASTATALAANGANCSAGQAPLGVDASGAVEGCFEVGASTMTEVDGHADGNLTAANVSNTIVYNTGQGDNNATLTLPTAAAGYSFIGTVGTTQAARTWRFQAKGTDKIYLDGTATADGGKACVTPAIGNYVTCFTFKTDAYDWICRTGIGTWWRE